MRRRRIEFGSYPLWAARSGATRGGTAAGLTAASAAMKSSSRAGVQLKAR